jgi:rhodanese-related sulfurtransferase
MASYLISKEQVRKKIDSGEDIYLIDARPEEIYTGGNDQIQGAKHLNEQVVHELYINMPKNKEYIIYSSKGDEEISKKFAEFMREKGFEAFAIEGGYEEWRDSGLPIEPIRAKGTPFLE